MELDVPTHSYSVLKEHLQSINKQKEIELYYELLSSGHSVGEILDSLGHLQCKSEHGNVTTAEHPTSRVDRVAPDVTSEAALMGEASANIQHIPDLTAPAEAESGRTDDSPLKDLGSGDRLKFAGESFPGSETNIDRSAAVHTSVDSEIEIPPGNQELRQRGKFSVSAKQFAIGALYTVAVASASIGSFAYLRGGPNADPMTTRVQSGISSGAEAVTIRASAAEGSETVDESLKATARVVNANSPSAPESSQSADSHSAVPGSLQKEAAEVSITFPASTSHIRQMEEPSPQVKASAFKNHDAVGSGTGRSRDVSVPMAEEIGGQQIVHAFYTALERGDGEAASLLVIPEKREAGPFSAGELSRFYGRLEMPLRLLEVDRAGDNLYNVLYRYKVRNGRFCNGRSLVTTITLQNQALIEKIQSPSRC
jgi:hypothetical protein